MGETCKKRAVVQYLQRRNYLRGEISYLPIARRSDNRQANRGKIFFYLNIKFSAHAQLRNSMI